MRCLAIRDDDLSFWTDQTVIAEIYEPLFKFGVKVSFATVPLAVKASYRGLPERFYIDPDICMPICKNGDLVEYVRELINRGHAEIVLHGYNHSYCYYDTEGFLKYPLRADQWKPGLWWAPECDYKSSDRMVDEIKRGQSYLQRVFDSEVSVFVPPSNTIGRVLRDCPMDICSATPKLAERGVKRGWPVWLEQKIFRLRHGFTFPGVTKGSDRKEIAAISLADGVGCDMFLRKINRIMAEGFPVVVATHYWELNRQGFARDSLLSVCEMLASEGGKFSFVSQLINDAVDGH